MALSLQWAARQELSTCIYRLDAARSEMVHEKIRNSAAQYRRRWKRQFYSRKGEISSMAVRAPCLMVAESCGLDVNLPRSRLSREERTVAASRRRWTPNRQQAGLSLCNPTALFSPSHIKEADHATRKSCVYTVELALVSGIAFGWPDQGQAPTLYLCA